MKRAPKNLSANPFLKRELERPVSVPVTVEKAAAEKHPDGSVCDCPPGVDAEGKRIHTFRFDEGKR